MVLSQIGGTFRPSFTISCRGAAGENINYQSHDIIAAGTYRKGSQPIHFNLPSCAVLNEVCIEFFHRGRTKRKRMFEFWVHTSYLPKKGLLVLGKNELDNAVKDTKNLTFPVNFVVRVGFVPKVGILSSLTKSIILIEFKFESLSFGLIPNIPNLLKPILTLSTKKL